MTAKDIKILDRFLSEEAGRTFDMRNESGRLVYSILTQINLRGKNNE